MPNKPLAQGLASIPAVRAMAAKYGPDPATWGAQLSTTPPTPTDSSANSRATASPPDECPTCRGECFFQHRAAFGEPNFGRHYACPTCGGYGTVSAFAAALRGNSGIPPAQWDRCTFERFDPQRAPAAATAKAAAEAWANDAEKPFLVLLGSVGTGKTMLAIAAARRRVERQQPVTFTTVARMLDELRATNREGAIEPLGVVRGRLEQTAALVLDDLGADRVTDFATEQLFLILDHRWQRRMATCITSNIDPDALDARVRSRIMDRSIARIVDTTGPDIRLRGGA